MWKSGHRLLPTLTLGSLVARTVRNECLLVKTHILRDFVAVAWTD